jgi:hypothetical protein
LLALRLPADLSCGSAAASRPWTLSALGESSFKFSS